MSTFYRNIPNFITLCNGICGMLAIIFAQQGHFALGILCICFGTLFDACDGKVARLMKNSSEMGGELDSLCDCITFGIAPASLMLFYVEQTFGSLPIISIVGAAVYLSCVVWRLARFNVETTPDPEDHKSFKGLPSPLGAGLVCSGLWFLQIRPTHPTTALYFLLALSIITGWVMISRIRFIHIVSYASEHLSFLQLMMIVVPIFAICFLFHPLSWAFCFPLFAIISRSVAIIQSFSSAKVVLEEKEEEEEEELELVS